MTKEIETYDQHVHEGILLNANELSMNLPYSILTEIQKEIMKIDFNRYPDDDYAPLFDAYAKWMHIKPEQLIAGNGSDQMLGMVIGTVLSKG
ncbi:MAG: histidinol-phosphate aminotransferase, partial [Erysipelotrichaceae bacterium]|nr:histidinol-phosphate aminotransferase [Erysipelotrichaceae bacterium]